MNLYVVHLLTPAAWDAFQQEGSYAPESLEREGFIHFSFPWQVEQSANLHFAGEGELVMLWCRMGELGEALVMEAASTQEAFPHLYAPLKLERVERAEALERAPGGGFVFEDDELDEEE